jgi:5-methylcytosine-specific restriction endonuclease McrA
MQGQPTRTKRCHACGETKPVTEFYRWSRPTSDGYQPKCKPCDKASRQARRDPAKDRERYATDAEWHARRDDLNRVRRAAGIPQSNVTRRRLRRRLFDAAGGICAICGEAMTFADASIDHIVPLARGGKHERANLQVAHRVCNSVKGVSMPDAA